MLCCVRCYLNTDTIYSIRREGASGNADVSRDLVPLVASTSSTLDRVLPEDRISEVKTLILPYLIPSSCLIPMSHTLMSQTADLQHLEDFKRDLGALIEETLYALDKKKVRTKICVVVFFLLYIAKNK